MFRRKTEKLIQIRIDSGTSLAEGLKQGFIILVLLLLVQQKKNERTNEKSFLLDLHDIELYRRRFVNN
jgi:hypothetical protein